MKRKRTQTQETDVNNPKEKEERREKNRIFGYFILLVLLLFLCILFHSCRARDEPEPFLDRVYEEDKHHSTLDLVPTGENKRLNLAISDQYVVTDEEPVFYIGYPEENQYDVVFSLLDKTGSTMYQTKFVAPGTNVAIDGSSFLTKGEQTIDCLVSIYDHDNGALVSDCVTVVLNLNYQ